VFIGCAAACVVSVEKLIKLLLFVAETILGLLEDIVGVIVWHLMFIPDCSLEGAIVMYLVVFVMEDNEEEISLFKITDVGFVDWL